MKELLYECTTDAQLRQLQLQLRYPENQRLLLKRDKHELLPIHHAIGLRQFPEVVELVLRQTMRAAKKKGYSNEWIGDLGSSLLQYTIQLNAPVNLLELHLRYFSYLLQGVPPIPMILEVQKPRPRSRVVQLLAMAYPPSVFSGGSDSPLIHLAQKDGYTLTLLYSVLRAIPSEVVNWYVG